MESTTKYVMTGAFKWSWEVFTPGFLKWTNKWKGLPSSTVSHGINGMSGIHFTIASCESSVKLVEFAH